MANDPKTLLYRAEVTVAIGPVEPGNYPPHLENIKDHLKEVATVDLDADEGGAYIEDPNSEDADDPPRAEGLTIDWDTLRPVGEGDVPPLVIQANPDVPELHLHVRDLPERQGMAHVPSKRAEAADAQALYDALKRHVSFSTIARLEAIFAADFVKRNMPKPPA